MQVDTLTVGEFQANCYVVQGAAGQALVIDPGAEPAQILDLLSRRRLTVCAYLLTHGHMDHIGAIADLEAERPAPIALHPDDLTWAFTPQNQMPPFYGVPRRPRRVERLLQHGQTWSDAGLTYTILGTPGHSPGSVCVFFPEENALFSGDTLFAGSVGRTDLPGGDSRALAASLARLARLPATTAVYPGHGPDTDLGQELQTNYFMQGAGRRNPC